MNNFNYPKIHSVFERDEKGKFTSKFSKPEFEYLYRNKWECTEKIDGTSLKVFWDGEKITFGRKSEKADQIPKDLFSKLNEIFSVSRFEEMFEKTPLLLFGEGYGNRIQKVGKDYIPNGVDFILFDCYIKEHWLQRENLIQVSKGLNLEVVPLVGTLTLEEAIFRVRSGFDSGLGTAQAEGLILKTPDGLLNRSKNRIITKLKTKDFA